VSVTGEYIVVASQSIITILQIDGPLSEKKNAWSGKPFRGPSLEIAESVIKQKKDL
jgi:hypothetical protein